MVTLNFILKTGIRHILTGWITYKTGVLVGRYGGVIEYLLGMTLKEALELAKIKSGNIHLTHENLRQDEDVLDTWFSSALWPFSTLGWPENTLN